MEPDCSDFALYFKSFSHKSILAKEELNELILIAQKPEVYGKSVSVCARNIVIEKNQGYVNTVAQKFAKYLNHGMEFDDLMIEANFGLINAINNFKVEKGFCFLTYAKVWVYNALQIAVNKQASAVYVSLKANVKKRDYSAVSLNSDLGEENSCSLEDLLADTKNPEALELIARDTMNNEVNDMLNVLDDRERLIVEKYYGFGGEEISLMEISRLLNISKERVRQIRCSAEQKLFQEAEKKSMMYYLVA